MLHILKPTSSEVTCTRSKRKTARRGVYRENRRRYDSWRYIISARFFRRVCRRLASLSQALSPHHSFFQGCSALDGKACVGHRYSCSLSLFFEPTLVYRMSTAWTKGDRKARRQLEKALKSDDTDNVTRFALVRLLANKAEPVAAEVKYSTFCYNGAAVQHNGGVNEVVVLPFCDCSPEVNQCSFCFGSAELFRHPT